jgi:hypothetical protein
LAGGDSAWPVVESWLAEASCHVVVLPAERSRGGETLYRLQVTTASVLGAMALETAGILVDHGWLRLLGAGGDQVRGLAAWNGLGEPALGETLDRAFLVAHDAVGGFFALDGGAFGGPEGGVFYFAPDTLDWEPLERGYGDFVHWALAGDADGFYADLRWPGWQEELGAAGADEGFSLYPPAVRQGGQARGKGRPQACAHDRARGVPPRRRASACGATRGRGLPVPFRRLTKKPPGAK